MADFGAITLLLGMAMAVYAGVGSVVGQWRGSTELVASSRNAAYALPLVLGVSAGTLAVAFATHEFSIRYVADHSSRALDPALTWVAMYAGNDGSLLFLAFVFSVLSAVAVWRVPAAARAALPYTTAVLMGIVFFYLLVMVTMANPFAELPVAPPDGRGINPLLTHPGMFFHPPILMTGLIGVGIPFAFAMGHLMAGETGDGWIAPARFWGMTIWATLTIGLLLGSWWAYTILGWGGYWAWDPVENGGLLPWLPMTAFIHSVMVQRRRGIFRMWNVALIILAWGFAMYGMFMNRGGPIPSVHSFGQSTMGWTFLVFLAVNMLGAFALFYWRYKRLRSSSPLDSPLSREAAFLLNNLLFLMIAFVTLWGVVYPLLSQTFQGVTVTVGRPYYDTVAGPLFLALVVLMGVGPLLPWRRAAGTAVLRTLRLPLGVGVGVAALVIALGVRSPLPVLAFAVCGYAATGILREWWEGTLARRRRGGEAYPMAFVRLIASNRPRYGGYVAHLGVVMLAFSVTGSAFYSVQRDFNLAIGERATIGAFEIEYLSTSVVPGPDRLDRRAEVQVYRNGEPTTRLSPGYVFYPDFNMASTRAGIRSTPVEDLYIIASEFSEDGSAIFRIYVNPLVVWMWGAGVLLVLGTVVSLWPERARARVPTVPPAGSGV